VQGPCRDPCWVRRGVLDVAACRGAHDAVPGLRSDFPPLSRQLNRGGRSGRRPPPGWSGRSGGSDTSRPSPTRWRRLPRPDWLAEHLGRPGYRIVDCRFRVDGTGRQVHAARRQLGPLGQVFQPRILLTELPVLPSRAAMRASSWATSRFRLSGDRASRSGRGDDMRPADHAHGAEGSPPRQRATPRRLDAQLRTDRPASQPKSQHRAQHPWQPDKVRDRRETSRAGGTIVLPLCSRRVRGALNPLACPPKPLGGTGQATNDVSDSERRTPGTRYPVPPRTENRELSPITASTARGCGG